MRENLEEVRQKVESLRDHSYFLQQVARKYGCNDNLRQSIKETHEELSKIQNINTLLNKQHIIN